MPSNRLFMTLLSPLWLPRPPHHLLDYSELSFDVIFYVSLVELIYFKKESFSLTRWLKMQEKSSTSETRRRSGHVNARVESVVRWMKGSNCETDWTWDTVWYSTVDRCSFVLLSLFLECVKSHRSISCTLEAIFVCIGDGFMSIAGRSTTVKDNTLWLDNSPRRPQLKLYLLLSLSGSSVWWSFVNYRYGYRVSSLARVSLLLVFFN